MTTASASRWWSRCCASATTQVGRRGSPGSTRWDHRVGMFAAAKRHRPRAALRHPMLLARAEARRGMPLCAQRPALHAAPPRVHPHPRHRCFDYKPTLAADFAAADLVISHAGERGVTRARRPRHVWISPRCTAVLVRPRGLSSSWCAPRTCSAQGRAASIEGLSADKPMIVVPNARLMANPPSGAGGAAGAHAAPGERRLAWGLHLHRVMVAGRAGLGAACSGTEEDVRQQGMHDRAGGTVQGGTASIPAASLTRRTCAGRCTPRQTR